MKIILVYFDSMIGKLIDKIGEQNLPFVYAFIFITITSTVFVGMHYVTEHEYQRLKHVLPELNSISQGYSDLDREMQILTYKIKLLNAEKDNTQ